MTKRKDLVSREIPQCSYSHGCIGYFPDETQDKGKYILEHCKLYDEKTTTECENVSAISGDEHCPAVALPIEHGCSGGGLWIGVM